jgi:hypothetical protein
MGRKRELTPFQKRALTVVAVIEFAAKLIALRDIQRRPAYEIRGSKRAWRFAQAVNFFGPAAYFTFGRRSA